MLFRNKIIRFEYSKTVQQRKYISSLGNSRHDWQQKSVCEKAVCLICRCGVSYSYLIFTYLIIILFFVVHFVQNNITFLKIKYFKKCFYSFSMSYCNKIVSDGKNSQIFFSVQNNKQFFLVFAINIFTVCGFRCNQDAIKFL